MNARELALALFGAIALFVGGIVGIAPLLPAIAQTFSLPNGTMALGHVLTGLGSGMSVPTIGGTSCGTTALISGSTDFAGEFTVGGTSTCKLTFGTPYAVGPFCTVATKTTASTYTTNGTGITMGTTVSGDRIVYICVGQPGN